MFVCCCVLVVMNSEEDIGVYTIKVANDTRACNRTVIYRPSTNIVTQMELISKWEKKTGRNFKKIHIPEEQVVALSESKSINYLSWLVLSVTFSC